MSPNRNLLLLAWSLAGVVVPAAGAHEFWIAPSRYDATRGAPVTLGAVAGTGFRGERKPWSPDHAVRWTLRAAKPIDLTRGASPGELVWTRFAPSDEGGAMVSFESDYLPIQLPAGPFDAYLANEGLDAALARRRTQRDEPPGRERYRRCAKAWLAGGDATRATAAVGLSLELVPDGAPGTTEVLRVHVLKDGRPLAGTLVRAWRTALDPEGAPRPAAERDSVAAVWQGRSDANGTVTVPTRAPGEWLVSTVHMEPSRDPSADWESTWASLTFVRATPAKDGR